MKSGCNMFSGTYYLWSICVRFVFWRVQALILYFQLVLFNFLNNIDKISIMDNKMLRTMVKNFILKRESQC